jgi:hypothetical protein
VAAPFGQIVADSMYDTANRPPEALRGLREAADAGRGSRGGPARRGVILVIDGLRVDEAERLSTWRRLRGRSDVSTAVVALPLPTLSTAYYHALLTGVPPDGSGVRTNRFTQRARLDSLADRVRASGGMVAWVAEDLDWFPRLFARGRDRRATGVDALGAPLRDELARLAGGRGAGLTVIHVVSVDDTAHASGIDAEAHRIALRVADRVMTQVERAAAAAGAVLLVVGDHGHIRNGGHGGDEPEVARAPLLLRAPGLMRGRAGEIRVEQIAPTLAAWMGVDPPRSAVARAPSRIGTDADTDTDAATATATARPRPRPRPPPRPRPSAAASSCGAERSSSSLAATCGGSG